MNINPCRLDPCWWCERGIPHPSPRRVFHDRPDVGPHEAAQLGGEHDMHGANPQQYADGWQRHDPITSTRPKGSRR